MRKNLSFVIALMLALIVLVACAPSETALESATQVGPTLVSEMSEDPEINSEISTITIEHKLGTAEVVLNPTKVVSLDLAAVDTLTAFDEEESIIAVSSLIPTYLADTVADDEIVGTMFEPDFEAIAALNPDVILISARSASVYEDLAEIAPVIYLAYPGIDNPNIVDTVIHNVELLASLYEKEDVAQTLITDLQTNVENLSASVASLENRDALMLIITGKEINAYGPEESSRYGYVFNLFNFNSPVSQEELDQEANKHGQSISFEFISEINPDYIFVIDRGIVTGNAEVEASETLDNTFVENTKAFENNNIKILSGEHWYLTVGGYDSLSTIIADLSSAIE